MATWSEIKKQVTALANAYRKLEPPPVPDDGWSQKANTMAHTIQSMQEHVDSRLQAQDEHEAAMQMRREAAAE